MNKKRMLLSMLLFCSATVGFSQESVKYGLKAGLNLSSLVGEYPAGLTHKSQGGFHAGVTAEYDLKGKFSLVGELLVSTQGGVSEYQKNYFNSFMGNYYEKQTQTINVTYLNLPVLVKYHITEKFSVEAGPQIGYAVSAKSKLEYVDSTDPSNNETITLNMLEDGTFTSGGVVYSHKKGINRMDFGFNIGTTYELSDRIFVQGRYNRGISNVDANSTSGSDTSSWNIKNSVFQLSVGYKFK